MVNGKTAEQLTELVKQAVAKKGLLIFLFHGVGGEHGLNVSINAHSKLLQYLKQQQNELWIAPMIEVAEFVKKNQEKKD